MNLIFEIKCLMSNILTRVIELRDEFDICEKELKPKVKFDDYEDLLYDIKYMKAIELEELHEKLKLDFDYLKHMYKINKIS